MKKKNPKGTNTSSMINLFLWLNNYFRFTRFDAEFLGRLQKSSFGILSLKVS